MSEVLRLPRKMKMDTSKVLRLPRKMTSIFGKRRESIACHAKRLSTRDPTRPHVTRCHAKRGEATLETSKNDAFCNFYHRHGITTRRQQTTARHTGGEHRSNPQTPNYKWEPFATHSGIKEEKVRESRKKEDAGAQKGRGAVCFSVLCGSGRSRNRLAKAAGAAEPCGQRRDEQLHAVDTVVARSTFPSQHVQNATASDHF